MLESFYENNLVHESDIPLICSAENRELLTCSNLHRLLPSWKLLHLHANSTDTVDATVQVNMVDSQSFPLNEPSV